MSIDPYVDEDFAALYDLFYADYDDDLAMYEAFARRGETPTLELGAGTGRVALHLARAGLDVVALDGSTHMLARLRAVLDAEPALAKRVRIVEGDMRSFDLGERFDLIFCAANTFGHLLMPDDQIAALRCVGAHLAHGGVFVARVQSPGGVDWRAEDAALRLDDSRIDPATGEIVTRLVARRADPANMQTTTTRMYDRVAGDGLVRRRVISYTLKYTPPDELRLVLDAAGLRLRQLYGGHDLSPYTGDSDSMVFVAGCGEG